MINVTLRIQLQAYVFMLDLKCFEMIILTLVYQVCT